MPGRPLLVAGQDTRGSEETPSAPSMRSLRQGDHHTGKGDDEAGRPEKDGVRQAPADMGGLGMNEGGLQTYLRPLNGTACGPGP